MINKNLNIEKIKEYKIFIQGSKMSGKQINEKDYQKTIKSCKQHLK